MIKRYILDSFDEICRLRDLGLTMSEIYQMLVVDIGVPCSFGTFRTYFNRLNG